jgi:hypothetical protein
VFLRAPGALTRTQVTGLVKVAHAFGAAGGVVKVIGPRGQVTPDVFQSGVSASLREAPWAATSVGARWSVALIAAFFSLAALLLTLMIDTIDRRRDVRRLERIGATPAQVRGGAALHAGAIFVTVTWLSALLVSALVITGTHAFNHDQPEIPVPFTMPWLVVAGLAIGLPAVAAALAALVARPASTRSAT